MSRDPNADRPEISGRDMTFHLIAFSSMGLFFVSMFVLTTIVDDVSVWGGQLLALGIVFWFVPMFYIIGHLVWRGSKFLKIALLAVFLLFFGIVGLGVLLFDVMKLGG